jgi:UDPglucose 6-dehydrogenase
MIETLYEPFNRNHERIFLMDTRSAELTKYAANAILATKISFMNELSGLSELLGADVEQVRVGIGSDPRIGYEFIYPGCGYGGSCFPKDVRALVKLAADAGFHAELIEAVERVNDRQKDVVFSKLSRHFGGDLSGKTVALWGLAFKPNTDDMREAPARNFMDSALAAGMKVQAYDPVAMAEARRIYGERPNLTFCSSAKEALDSADALVLVTEWQEFRSPDFTEMKTLLASPVVVDGRNVFDPETMRTHGFSYYAVGRGD